MNQYSMLEGAHIHRDLEYVENGHARHKLDLYLPATQSGAIPLIVWIHGGAFRMGAKDDFTWDTPPWEYLALGCAVASINYRLSQHAIWPAQIIDCNAAVRWLRAHALQYGLDARRFAVWGPSAGGHLASMVGLTSDHLPFRQGGHLDVASNVCCVVDYFGPTNFLQMDSQRLTNGMLHDPADSPESQLIGGPIQQNPDAVMRANPVTYVSSASPPFLIVHGNADPLVPYGQSLLLHAALQQAHVPVTFHTVAGGGHGKFTDPQVPQVTREYLTRYLKLSAHNVAT